MKFFLLTMIFGMVGLKCAAEPPLPILLQSSGRNTSAQSDIPISTGISTNDNPYAPFAFENEVAMEKWAQSTFGGAKSTKLTYQKRKLVVYFRSYTSGVATTEPVVFVEKGGRWIQVFRSMMCSFDMEATIERDSLILWRLEWPNGKRQETEFLRFNLANLDAA